jgi:hypothetical protein
MRTPPPAYSAMSVAEILESLFVGVYEYPLAQLRDDLKSIPAVLRIPILVIDLDTEVTINGMLGFLENSTGLYLVDTIEALEMIGAHKAADSLRAIQQIMSEHGVTVERLRGDLDKAELFEITNFLELHGEDLVPMAEQIECEARRLNVYDPAEPAYDLLRAYLEGRRNELIAALDRFHGPD